MSEFIKKYKVLLVVAVIGIIILLVILCAKGIVKSSYSSEEYVAEEEGVYEEEEVQAPEAQDNFQMEYSGESVGGTDKVSQMYNPDRVESDLERYLEGTCDSPDAVVKILSDIEANSSEAFSEISKGKSQEYDEIVYYNSADNAELSAEQLLNDGKYSIIESSLVVVGLFDGNKVIYGYNFPDCHLYICVDYSDADFIVGSEEVWKIGDIKDISVVSEDSVYKDMETYQVIYTKG